MARRRGTDARAVTVRGLRLNDPMTAIGKLAAISLDADNPAELGDFYVRLLDAEVTFTSDTSSPCNARESC
jgi:hypothetical protein